MESSAQIRSDRRPVIPRRFAWVQALAAGLAKTGISPNAISLCGLVAGAMAGWCWSQTASQPSPARAWWLMGILLVLLRILANTLDGMVAVEWGKASKVGVLYNDVPDRLSDAALLIGMGCARGGDFTLGVAAVGIALFVTYARLIGRLAGAPSDFSGPMDKGGRMIVLVLAALFMGLAPTGWTGAIDGTISPPNFALVAICLGGVLTAARRLLRAAAYLKVDEV